jgi:OHCU decarboxylase
MAQDEQRQLDSLNDMPEQSLRAELLRCCGSKAWVNGMVAHKPFTNAGELLDLASTVWFNLPVKDWKEAFSAHPQIGNNVIFVLCASQLNRTHEIFLGDAAALKSKFAHSKWEGDEQKGANLATDETLQQLAQLNAQYLSKNRFIFLICATGKSADEMVKALQYRMLNDSTTEVR